MANTLTLTPVHTVRLLFWLRCLVLVLMLIAFIAIHQLQLAFALPPLLLVFGLLCVWNLLTGWRLLKLSRWQATELEVLTHLATDTLALTAILMFSGGPVNPFVSLYLLPIAVAAAALPMRSVWAITTLCLIGYGSLMWQHHYGPMANDNHHSINFETHITGMWVNFVISALLMTLFVAAMARAVRRRDQQLAEHRETQLRDEQILALGTLAAGTAHELSTPLSTIAVLADEIRQTHADDDDLAEDLRLLASQVEVCRDRIEHLLTQSRQDTPQPVLLADYLAETTEHWQVTRPEISLQLKISDAAGRERISPNRALSQCITNLLDNAADASRQSESHHVALRASLANEPSDDPQNHRLIIEIEDEGPGLEQHWIKQAGRRIYSSKPQGKGHGLGLVLSHVSIERLGGSLSVETAASGGACTRMHLPLPLINAHS